MARFPRCCDFCSIWSHQVEDRKSKESQTFSTVLLSRTSKRCLSTQKQGVAGSGPDSCAGGAKLLRQQVNDAGIIRPLPLFPLWQGFPGAAISAAFGHIKWKTENRRNPKHSALCFYPELPNDVFPLPKCFDMSTM